MGKRVTFSYSIDAGLLATLVAQHSDARNITEHFEPDKKTRQPKALANGVTLALPAPSAGRAAEIEVLIRAMLKSAGVPLAAKAFIAEIGTRFHTGGSSFYATAKRMIAAGELVRANGAYALAPSAKTKKKSAK